MPVSLEATPIMPGCLCSIPVCIKGFANPAKSKKLEQDLQASLLLTLHQLTRTTGLIAERIGRVNSDGFSLDVPSVSAVIETVSFADVPF